MTYSVLKRISLVLVALHLDHIKLTNMYIYVCRWQGVLADAQVVNINIMWHVARLFLCVANAMLVSVHGFVMLCT